MPQTTTTMRFASAISQAETSEAAIDSALHDIADQMAGLPVDLLIITMTFHHAEVADHIVDQAMTLLTPAAMIGTTAGGVVANGIEVEGDPAITLLAAHLPGAAMNTFTYNDLDWPASAQAPHDLRHNLMGDLYEDEPKLVMMFADPFSVPMSKLLPTLDKATDGAPVVGGMASGALEPNGNRMLIDGRALTEGAVGVVLTGNLSVETTVSQGCRPIGHPLVITQCNKNLIQQLGGQNVMQVVREMTEQLDTENRMLMQQGLLVGRVINEYKDRFGRGDFLIRNVLGAAKDESYIAVSDFVKVGQTVQFHVRDKRTAEEDLHLLLDAQKLHGPPAGVFLCTCNGRGTGMYEQPDRETTIIAQHLGDVPLTGFFAAGEIGPIGHNNFVHGFTASMALFRPLDATP